MKGNITQSMQCILLAIENKVLEPELVITLKPEIKVNLFSAHFLVYSSLLLLVRNFRTNSYRWAIRWIISYLIKKVVPRCLLLPL
jgi:hypothetical protein